jgi:hypothetical protein
VLEGEIVTALAAENLVRNIADASRYWATRHTGLTLILIENNYGPVISMRNAQAWLMMPPIEPEPLLHRMLPTPTTELEKRYDQLAEGLGARLETMKPSRLDSNEFARLFEKDAARWPRHYVCWSTYAGRLVEINPPDHADRTQWSAALRKGMADYCATDVETG